MVKDTKNGFDFLRYWSAVGRIGLVLACLFLLVAKAAAQEGAVKPPAGDGAADGLFITVHNPITTNVVSRVKDKTLRFLQRPDHRGLTIVYDFNPDSHPSFTGDYGPCHDL